MLADTDVDEICRTSEITEEGRKFLDRIRKLDPSGPDRERERGRIAGEYPSAKMGFAIYCPNAKRQIPLLLHLDRRQSLCREMWPWAEPIGIKYSAKLGGTPFPVSHTPFLSEIRSDGVYLSDFFYTSELEKHVKNGSDRYRQDAETGTWTSPPMEEALARYGFKYIIYTEYSFGEYWLANASLLREYMTKDYHVHDPIACENFKKELKKSNGFIPIKEATDEKKLINGSDLLYGIANEWFFFPLMTESLVDNRQATVFLNQEVYEDYVAYRHNENGLLGLSADAEPQVGTRFSMHGQSGWCIGADHGHEWGLERGTLTTRMLKYDFQKACVTGEIKLEERSSTFEMSTAEMRAYARFKIDVLNGEILPVWTAKIRPSLDGEPISQTTLARWRSKYKSALEKFPNNPVLGMLPGWPGRGPSGPRYPQSLELWDEIYHRLRLKERKPLQAVHDAFVIEAKAKGLDTWSDETSRKLDVEYRQRSIWVEALNGRSARYAVAGHISPAKRDRLYSFRLPYILAHADHTPVAIKLENSATGEMLQGQLWLSMLVDNATGQKLAYVLCFWPPSARTISLLLFQCLHRHGFLPTFVALDNAPEFKGVVTHLIANEAECTLLWRPPYSPRDGAPVESANAQFEANFLRKAAGETKSVKNLEMYSRAFRSSSPDLMTLTELRHHLDGLFYEIEWEHRSARTGSETMRQYVERTTRNYLDKNGKPTYRRLLRLTEDVRRICMPPAPSGGTRIVQPGGYVEVEHLRYYSDFLLPVVGKTVDVTVDVIDPSRVYTYHPITGGRTCICEFLLEFRHFTRNEIEGLIGELRQSGSLLYRSDTRGISQEVIKLFHELEQDPNRLKNRAGRKETVEIWSGPAGFPDSSASAATPEKAEVSTSSSSPTREQDFTSSEQEVSKASSREQGSPVSQKAVELTPVPVPSPNIEEADDDSDNFDPIGRY